MIEQQKIVRANGGYNELVLDTRPWVQQLPQTIEAMFVLPFSKPADIDYVRTVHANLLGHYKLSADEGPPIVTYDARQREPFALSDHG